MLSPETRIFSLVRVMLILAILIAGTGTTRAYFNNPSAQAATQIQPETRAAQPAALLAPAITATKNDTLLTDVDGDGNVDPGDTIRYTIVVNNTGSSDA